MSSGAVLSRRFAVLFLYVVPLLMPFLLPAPKSGPLLLASVGTPALPAPAPVVQSPPPVLQTVNAAVLRTVDPLDVFESDDNRCLAQAIYFEARGEPIEGQVAVAQVVLNRVANPRYPDSICGVVFQNEWHRNRCQFSFACDGRSDRPKEAASWDQSRRIAHLVLSERVRDFSLSATHYHAKYVTPKWASRLHETAEVGLHVFYRE